MGKELVKSWRKRWSINKERKAQIENAKTLSVGDELYKPTLDAIEQTTKVRNTKIELGLKALQVVGTLVIGGFVAKAAYSIDKSDEILQNKNSMGFFGKIFKF